MCICGFFFFFFVSLEDVCYLSDGKKYLKKETKKTTSFYYFQKYFLCVNSKTLCKTVIPIFPNVFWKFGHC